MDYEDWIENRDYHGHLSGPANCPGCGCDSMRDDTYGPLFCIECAAFQTGENARIDALATDGEPI